MTDFGFSFTRFSSGRTGIITTPHGSIQTPAFVFCATKGSLKTISMSQAVEEETQIILSNTYHLLLNPGGDRIEKMGGLHRFCGWKGPMLSDSGGFQIFSLGHGSVSAEIKGRGTGFKKKSLVRITEQGALFRSYIDGSPKLLTPESAMDLQRHLGVDLVVCFDECTPFHSSKEYTRESMYRSHRWELRSFQHFNRHDNGQQKLYGIVQGGVYEDLRKESIDFVNAYPFFGHAIGGSLGATKEQMYEVVRYIVPNLSPERPIHLLGIGGIQDIFEGVRAGVDTFDCVHPTRIARHGCALIRRGDREHIHLKNSIYKEDALPIEEGCPCHTCTHYTRGYIHYLLRAKEPYAYQLLTLHNVRFMNRLMQDIRSAIPLDCLNEVEAKYVVA